MAASEILTMTADYPRGTPGVDLLKAKAIVPAGKRDIPAREFFTRPDATIDQSHDGGLTWSPYKNGAADRCAVGVADWSLVGCDTQERNEH